MLGLSEVSFVLIGTVHNDSYWLPQHLCNVNTGPLSEHYFMDDLTHSAGRKNKKANSQFPLGMNSFGPEHKQQFSRNIRLAMSCIEGIDEPANLKAIPVDEATVRHRLRTLTQEMNSSQADLLELLVLFDELEGWKSSGAKHCVACAESAPGKYGFKKLIIHSICLHTPLSHQLLFTESE